MGRRRRHSRVCVCAEPRDPHLVWPATAAAVLGSCSAQYTARDAEAKGGRAAIDIGRWSLPLNAPARSRCCTIAPQPHARTRPENQPPARAFAYMCLGIKGITVAGPSAYSLL